jgi:hypothetical protein
MRGKKLAFWLGAVLVCQLAIWEILELAATDVLRPLHSSGREFVLELSLPPGTAPEFALSHNSRYLAVTAGDGLQIVDLNTGQRMLTLAEGVIAWSWLPDRNALVTLATEDGLLLEVFFPEGESFVPKESLRLEGEAGSAVLKFSTLRDFTYVLVTTPTGSTLHMIDAAREVRRLELDKGVTGMEALGSGALFLQKNDAIYRLDGDSLKETGFPEGSVLLSAGASELYTGIWRQGRLLKIECRSEAAGILGAAETVWQGDLAWDGGLRAGDGCWLLEGPEQFWLGQKTVKCQGADYFLPAPRGDALLALTEKEGRWWAGWR